LKNRSKLFVCDLRRIAMPNFIEIGGPLPTNLFFKIKTLKD